MKLYIDDRIISIIFKTKENEVIFKNYFTWKDDSKAFFRGKYDVTKIKKVCFMKHHKSMYLLKSGFLQEVMFLIKSNEIKVTEIVDKRTKFNFMKKEYSIKSLEKYFPFEYVDHQTSALKKILKVNKGIAVLPTSAGKTEIFLAYLKITNLPTLIVVNKVLLSEQIYERIIKYGINDVGINTGSKKRNLEAKVIVSTIGSVKNLNLSKFKCLIGDEVHNFSSKTFQDFLEKVSFPIQIGFSATPNKGKPYQYSIIRQFMGDVIAEVKSKELMDNKVMAEPFIYFVKNKLNDGLDYHSSYLKEIIQNRERNNSIVRIVENFDTQILILLQDVVNGQGEYLKEKIAEFGKKVEFISGETKDRNFYIENFEKENINVLIATNILNEGISINNINLLINAAGMKSYSLTAQKIGRGLRTKKGKSSVAVVDFIDEGNKFLEKHSKIRYDIFKKLGFHNILKLNLEELLEYDEKSIIKKTR